TYRGTGHRRLRKRIIMPPTPLGLRPRPATPALPRRHPTGLSAAAKDSDVGAGRSTGRPLPEERITMAISAETFEALELVEVGRSFGDRTALQGLSMTIRAGEFIALLGPSGCGKSTALNCLAGLLPLTTGQILIDGQRVDTVPAERRGFGMVFQNYALFPHMSVRRNIAFGLEMRRMATSEMRSRVDEAIALVKLEDHADK